MSGEIHLIYELMQGHTDAATERQILDLIANLDAEQLNQLLTVEGTERLFASIDDRLVGEDNGTALRRLLTEQRAPELDLHATAAVIYALQTGHTSRAVEQTIADLLCRHEGEELTHLKNIINLRHDHHDLEGLVFDDIDTQSVRERIVQHFAHQTRGLALDEAKILSDIDDTIFCKLHDRRYPRGTLYPGVLAFLEALDLGPENNPLSIGDLTFVTARPMDFFGLIENHSRESLKKAGISELSVMSGSVLSLVTHDAMARKKIQNINHYAQLFPEYRIIFLGDSGQGDLTVGEKLWEDYPNTVEAVFIHDVVDSDDEQRRQAAQHKIWYFDTYVGAAVMALEANLISDRGFDEVVREAGEALDKISWESPSQESRVRLLHSRDADLVSASAARQLAGRSKERPSGL